MKTQTSLVAQQVRLSECAEQIRECRNRPQGMKVDEWCTQQGITQVNCLNCGGTGRYEFYSDWAGNYCRMCDGDGRCPGCDGRGYN